MARIKDASVEAVKAATDIVALVEGYTRLRKSGSRYVGLCPFHQEKTPSFGVSPDRRHFQVLRLRRGRGRDHVRREAREPRLRRRDRVARRPVRRPARVRGDLAGAGPPAQAARAAFPAARSRGHVLRAPPLGVRERRLRARLPRLPRPEGRGVPRVPPRPRARRGGARARCREPGLHQRRAHRRRPRQPPRQRLLLAPSDVPARGRARARAGLPGAAAVRGRPAPREVRQLARGRPLPQGRPALRARPRARGDREAGPRRDRRGQPRCDRAAPGRVRAGGRRDGHGPHRSAPARALPADEEPRALLRRRRSRPGGDAARDGARGQPGLRHQGRLAGGGH